MLRGEHWDCELTYPQKLINVFLLKTTVILEIKAFHTIYKQAIQI